MATIVPDEQVFAQIKEESRKQYRRIWSLFHEFISSDVDLESGPPGEECLSKFFKHLREEKNYASTSMWTFYSCLNSVMKRKYNVKLQELPRLTMLIKGFDTDIKGKAPIFDESQLKAFMLGSMESSYWLVRQAIVIVAFFGGLRLKECQDLLLEKMVRSSDGYKVTHSSCKQRSDQRDTAFLVPENGGFAARLGVYLAKVNSDLSKFSGQAWWTGTKGQQFKNQPLGRNMIGKVTHDVAIRLNLPNPESYTFHSYRRTSATSAANGGMSSEQMQDFYGWKSASMCKEYISTSVPAIKKMAQTLGNFDMEEPEVEMEPVTEVVVPVVEVLEKSDPLMVVDVLTEEESEMYKAAGISLVTASIQKSLESSISSVPCVQGANVTVKVCVISNNTGNVNL